MVYFERAVAESLAELSGGGRLSRVTYKPTGTRQNFNDPEEQVRAEFWAELIFRYGYEPDRIGIEVVVPDRTPHDIADLVIFRDNARRRPFAVIECKRDGISDTEFNQAIEQAAGNGTWAKLRASYVGVVAGSTRRFLDFSDNYGSLEREQNIIADLPIQYGKPAEYKYHKDTRLDIQPVSRHELIAAIKKCHQTLWGGGRLSPPSAFGELCKMIFVKIADEQAPRRPSEPYQFQIKTHEPSRALAERIRTLYEKQQARDPDIFTERIRVSDAALRTIVSHLEYINLSKTDLDTKGLAFEQFMDSFFKGDFGQYFTPRQIIELCVRMVGVQADDKVIDPACGSGGFLLYAMDAVRREASKYFDNGSAEHYRQWHDFASRRLYGIEINDEISRVAKMNMILHDDGHTNVVNGDALEVPRMLQRENPGLSLNSFDVVLTNPPFGASVNQAEHPYLMSYELAAHGTGNGKSRTSQKTEILFIERVWQLLKPGTGRAAIVLPDGILTNGSLQYVRDFIVEKFQLMAVVSLPSTAFTHYGAGVKASVVILRRLNKNEVLNGDEMVFMSAPELIGYDASGRETDNELPNVVEEYHDFLDDPTRFIHVGSTDG